MHALWSKISPRERRLAIATASVIVLSAVWFVSLKALSSLDLLDGTIGAIRQELAYQEELARQADTVDRAFNGIATEHSSRWTQEEIHDRLRLEITRLAAENVPPPGAPVPAGSPTLVKFKSLPSGVLYPGGKGYRQYHIELQTQPTSIKKLTTFLERLQESKQALRVDRLEIRRPPEANQVTADIGVTRTVIDADLADQVSPAGDAAGSPPAGANLVRNPSFEAWDEDSATFRHWGADRLDIGRGTMGASDGALCLTGRALAAGAAVYQRQEVVAGKTYDLYADLATDGGVRLGVAVGGFDQFLEDPVVVAAERGTYRYRIRFTVPENLDGFVSFYAPSVVLEGEGNSLTLDNVALSMVED